MEDNAHRARHELVLGLRSAPLRCQRVLAPGAHTVETSVGLQSMFPAQFDRLMAELRIIAPAIGRSICLEPVARRGWAR